MVAAQDIEIWLEEALPGAVVKVNGDDGVHFEAYVVSPLFQGKSLLARHRIVYEALGDKMRAEIHALSLRTLTPEEAA